MEKRGSLQEENVFPTEIPLSFLPAACICIRIQIYFVPSPRRPLIQYIPITAYWKNSFDRERERKKVFDFGQFRSSFFSVLPISHKEIQSGTTRKFRVLFLSSASPLKVCKRLPFISAYCVHVHAYAYAYVLLKRMEEEKVFLFSGKSEKNLPRICMMGIWKKLQELISISRGGREREEEKNGVKTVIHTHAYSVSNVIFMHGDNKTLVRTDRKEELSSQYRAGMNACHNLRPCRFIKSFLFALSVYVLTGVAFVTCYRVDLMRKKVPLFHSYESRRHLKYKRTWECISDALPVGSFDSGLFHAAQKVFWARNCFNVCEIAP